MKQDKTPSQVSIKYLLRHRVICCYCCRCWCLLSAPSDEENERWWVCRDVGEVTTTIFTNYTDIHMYAPYSKAYRVFIFSAYHTFRIYLLPFMYHGNILRFLQVHAWSYDTQSKCLMNIWEKTDFFAFKWFSVSLALKNDFFSAAVSVLFRFVLSIKWPFFESKSYYTQFYTVSWSHFKHTHFTCSSVLLLLLVINFSLSGFLPSLYLCRISEFGFGSNSNSNDGVER